MKPTPRKSPDAADKPISYTGYRCPPVVISYAVWLYFRFPRSLRMVEERLAARGIEATCETVRRWALT
jgi:putative transposase